VTSESNETAPRSKLPLFMAGMFALFAAGIGTCAAIFLMPKGERVGVIDLTAPTPLTVALHADSTLSFRLDTTVVAPEGESSSRATRNVVYDTLGESTITLTRTPQGGPPSVATCKAYDGRFVSANDTETEVSVHGIPLTCTFTHVSGGQHVFTAQVVWARDLVVRAATLEVREARAD
jgi:hypothetical protein